MTVLPLPANSAPRSRGCIVTKAAITNSLAGSTTYQLRQLCHAASAALAAATSASHSNAVASIELWCAGLLRHNGNGRLHPDEMQSTAAPTAGGVDAAQDNCLRTQAAMPVQLLLAEDQQQSAEQHQQPVCLLLKHGSLSALSPFLHAHTHPVPQSQPEQK